MVAGLSVEATSLGRLGFCTLMHVKQWWRCFFRVLSLGMRVRGQGDEGLAPPTHCCLSPCNWQ